MRLVPGTLPAKTILAGIDLPVDPIVNALAQHALWIALVLFPTALACHSLANRQLVRQYPSLPHFPTRLARRAAIPYRPLPTRQQTYEPPCRTASLRRCRRHLRPAQ